MGQLGRYATSSDAVTWTINVDISLSEFYSVAVIFGKTIGFGAGFFGGASVILAGATRAEVLQAGGWNIFGSETSNGIGVQGFAYNGSNQYVFAGNRTAAQTPILTSTDGQTWTARVAPVNVYSWVYYLNGNYIAGGGSGAGLNVVTSSDGITWTGRIAGTAVYNSAAFGAGVYVVVGNSGAVFSSPDLITWTTRSAGANAFNDVIFANSLFVAVGASGTCYTSPDGITWTSRSAGSTQFNKVIYANSLFVALGNSGTIYTSPDGITWTLRATGVTGNLVRAVWSGSLFCAVGGGGSIATSPDGLVWTARTPGDTTATLNGVYWDGTKFLAMLAAGVAWTSTDGITWTRVSTANRGGSSTSAYLGGKFLSLGPNHIQTSTDGLNWTNCDHVQYVASSVGRLYKLGAYYYALSNGGLFESSDGITFTIADRTLPPTTAVAMAYSGSAWVLVVSAASGQPQTFYKSTNGTTWSKSADFGTFTNTSTIAGAAVDVNYANGNFIAAQTLTPAQNINAGIYTSSDGVTWTGRVLPYGAALTVGSGVGISSDGTNAYVGIDINAQILKSTDGGVTWTAIAASQAGGRANIYINGYLISPSWATPDGGSTFVGLVSFVSVSAIVYGYGNFAYTFGGNGASRTMINLKSGASSNIVAPASVTNFPFTTGPGKESPVRGTTLLLGGGTISNDRVCYAIGEIPLRSYNTATTFWVPPAGTAMGQTAYIYAGA